VPKVVSSCVVLLALLGLCACNFVRGYAEGRSTQMRAWEARPLNAQALGAARFLFDDFGSLNTDTLETNAVPWKVATAALVLGRGAAPTSEDVRAIFTEFGFLYPQRIENWPLPEQPVFDRPMGLVGGTISRDLPKVRLEAINTGCAVCHAGVSFDANGRPTRNVWLGLPNTSVNIDAFVAAIYQAIKSVRTSADRVLEVITQLYPQTTEDELRTIRKFVWPRLTRTIAQLEATGDRALPFDNGGPGITNGVAALKLRLGAPERIDQFFGTTAIPDLSDRALRSSLLYDGVYTRKGHTKTPAEAAQMAIIVAFFTVPTMGMKPERAFDAVPRVTEAMQFIQGYRAPAFPGAIDAPLAERGRAIYDDRCASCHGVYSNGPGRPELLSFPNRHVAQAEMETDATRWQAISVPLLASLRDSAFARHLEARNTGGYVAPILTGLWATAPYLHNGSVPTVWHLMHAEQRPKQFQVGGHALSFQTLGIDYPAGYEPWSKPMLFDTTQVGRSNSGHVREFDGLSEEEKGALLEFLKRL
jgi:hypothetical protein